MFRRIGVAQASSGDPTKVGPRHRDGGGVAFTEADHLSSAILCAWRRRGWGVVLLITLSACNLLTTESSRPTRVDLSREWVASDPASQGVDAARLALAVRDAGQ